MRSDQLFEVQWEMADPSNQSIETPRQLAARYRKELRELVDDGEISAEVAQRIMDDLFETSASGEPPTLRWSVWSTYVEDANRNSERIRLIDFTKAWRRSTKS